MRSARCLGVYVSGEVKRPGATVSAVTGVPHLLQNLDPAGSAVPHEAHVTARRAPHPRQKLESGGFACWQLGHVIREPRRARLETVGTGYGELSLAISAGQGA
jgi:hypothetical protein